MINPNMFTGLEKNLFTANERQTAIDFGYNQHYLITGSISIPDGYTFEDPPKNVSMIMPDTSIVFRRFISVEGQAVQFRTTLEFKRPFYAVEEYPDFKEFYKLLFTKLNEQVVFKKKA